MDFNSLAGMVTDVVNQYIVRPTGMPNQTGVAGFLFDVLDDEEVLVDSDITDHYIEDNSAIQDHIALRPVRFTVRGFVGELRDLKPTFNNQVMEIVERITSVASYIPMFTAQATSLYENITAKTASVGEVINQSLSVYNLFSQFSTTATKQQDAYNYFYSLWKGRVLCDVETPYRIFTNMAIENISANQTGVTRFISDFRIRFKEIRTVTTSVTGALLRQSGRVADMFADTVHGSQTPGTTTEFSSLVNLFNNSRYQIHV